MMLSSLRECRPQGSSEQGDLFMIVVVGAHSRNVGKTSIICSILRGTPEAEWTAVKISANRHRKGQEPRLAEEPALSADSVNLSDTASDTARYLAHGARRAFWLRACNDQLAMAAEQVRALSSGSANLIVESNRIVEHLEPDLYLLALDFGVEDFKDSARRLFGRADGYVVSGSRGGRSPWAGVPVEEIDLKPRYSMRPPDYRPRGLLREIRRRLGLRTTREAAA